MPDTSGISCKLFLGHALAIVGVAIWSLFTPLYVINTSEGETYSLTAQGWAGEQPAAYVLGTSAAASQTSIAPALAIAITGGLVLALSALWQKKASTGAWAILTLLAWVPAGVTCLFLGIDGFPMPLLTATNGSLGITITAGWGTPLWGLVVAASCSVGGAVTVPRLYSPEIKDILPAKVTLEGPAFHRLQAELAIRQARTSS